MNLKISLMFCFMRANLVQPCPGHLGYHPFVGCLLKRRSWVGGMQSIHRVSFAVSIQPPKTRLVFQHSACSRKRRITKKQIDANTLFRNSFPEYSLSLVEIQHSFAQLPRLVASPAGIALTGVFWGTAVKTAHHRQVLFS